MWERLTFLVLDTCICEPICARTGIISIFGIVIISSSGYWMF